MGTILMRVEVDEKMRILATNFVDEFRRITNDNLDFTVSSLSIFDKFLTNLSLNGVSSSRLEKDGGLAWIGSYLGEVIRRHIGGRWIAFGDILTLCQRATGFDLLNIIDDYYVTPISEIAWKVDHGPDNRIVAYFQSVLKEFNKYRVCKDKKIISKSSYEFIFPECYLHRIFEYREYDYEENHYAMSYIKIPIQQLNEWNKRK